MRRWYKFINKLCAKRNFGSRKICQVTCKIFDDKIQHHGKYSLRKKGLAWDVWGSLRQTLKSFAFVEFGAKEFIDMECRIKLLNINSWQGKEQALTVCRWMSAKLWTIVCIGLVLWYFTLIWNFKKYFQIPTTAKFERKGILESSKISCQLSVCFRRKFIHVTFGFSSFCQMFYAANKACRYRLGCTLVRNGRDTCTDKYDKLI